MLIFIQPVPNFLLGSSTDNKRSSLLLRHLFQQTYYNYILSFIINFRQHQIRTNIDFMCAKLENLWSFIQHNKLSRYYQILTVKDEPLASKSSGISSVFSVLILILIFNLSMVFMIFLLLKQNLSSAFLGIFLSFGSQKKKLSLLHNSCIHYDTALKHSGRIRWTETITKGQ